MFQLNSMKIRQDFPVLKQNVVYLDNACMSLKPQQVIDKMNEYYTKYTACAGRSIHSFSRKVEDEIAVAREQVRKLINSKNEETIFTRNTTEGINLIANSLKFKAGDEIVIRDKEHNTNLIPWLKLKKKGVKVVVVPSKEDNAFDLEEYESLVNEKTKLVSIVHVSNLDGVTNPVKEIAKIAHKHNALCHIDGAQSVPGKEVDVKSLNVDFLTTSGHKCIGPTGTGVLYGRKELLNEMDQFLVGGETVLDSTYESYEPEHLPNKFEAGLQDYAGIIGLGEAFRYLRSIGMSKIEKHEIKLNEIMTSELKDKVKLIGPEDPALRSGIFSFIPDKDIHHVAKMLDVSKKIMVRSGAHCVHSWFNKHNLKGSVRASAYLYNTEEDIAKFVEEVKKIVKL